MMLEILVQNGLAQFKIQNKLSLSLAHTCWNLSQGQCKTNWIEEMNYKDDIK